MGEGQAKPAELAPGLWSWARRHDEWHPGDFGSEVVSFLVRAGDETLLLDPLLDGPDDPAWELINSELGDSLRILICIPYHVRSTEAVRERYHERVSILSIHGHPDCAERLESTAAFEPFVAGDELPAGITAHRSGKPRHKEAPLHLPSHEALLFGDVIVGTDDGPRMWTAEEITDEILRFQTEDVAPTLQPLLDLNPERLLLTHGPSTLSGGREALAEALAKPPWYHPG